VLHSLFLKPHFLCIPVPNFLPFLFFVLLSLCFNQAFERAASVYSQRLCHAHNSDPRYHYTPFQPSSTISGDALKTIYNIINKTPSESSSVETASAAATDDGGGADGNGSASDGNGADAGERMRQDDALPSSNDGSAIVLSDEGTTSRFGPFLDHSELAQRYVNSPNLLYQKTV